MQEFFFQKSLIDEDRRTILQVIAYIKDLNEKKISLEKENARMLVIKKEVDSQSTFLAGEVAKSKKFESEISGKIAVLSARQQDIIAQRQGSLHIPQSAYTSVGGCSDDRNVDPGFGSAFAFFSYGVPNRVGLNQYGAKGRAEAGQNAQTILSAYYNADYTTGNDQGVNIHVVGSNEYGQSFDTNWSIEEYVKHIYEMPTSWPDEALRAQAIAARSYALATTNNGANSICPSQSCQVVKQEINDQRWQDAVNATAGIVLKNGGQPIKAWFSSTHGGFVFSSGDIGWNQTPWTKNAVDTSSGSVGSFDDLKNNAYDRSSPWFYCDWGYRAQYNKTAWLKPEEVADLANVVMLVSRDSSTSEHLYQPDNPPSGTETWNQERVKSELRSRGGNPYNSISNVSVDWSTGSGRTTSVHVSGDAGDNSFDAVQFRNFFNIRAPANIYIAGPLFNIERR
jgi:SpoIID/LytB domain protein